MRRSRLLMGLGALVAAMVLPNWGNGQAQLGNQLPHLRIINVTPCGGKIGTSFQVALQGTDVDEPEALLFSHPGIKAEIVLAEPKAAEPKKEGMKKGKQQVKTLQFKVSIADSVPVGGYDVRLVGKFGVSNARAFVVGDLDEVNEKEPNNDIEQAQRVELNTSINGVIAQPTDVDYYVFKGIKGQRVLLECLCASIDSRLTPDIKVLDRDNREIAGQHAAPLTDGLVDVILPEDGDYRVRLAQFAYQLGGPEVFYRLNITTGPWIDAVFPPMAEPGKPAQVTLLGRNLPGGVPYPGGQVAGRPLEMLSVTINPPTEPAARHRITYGAAVNPLVGTQDGFEYRIKNGNHSSNPVLITYARAPVVLEKEPNDTPETAQEVPVPSEIAGRIDKRMDRDWYSFTAKKGDTYIIDLLSNRLGAATDLYMTIRNATGKEPAAMAQLDDNPETLHPLQFQTSSHDPAPYRFVAPADGKYQIQVGSHLASVVSDVQQQYRLRISPEVPDFRLFVMPSDTFRPDSCQLGAGGNEDLAVFVLRQDGFQDEVELTASGLPEGVTCKKQVIGRGMKQGSLVLSASLDAKPWSGTIQIKGTALIGGTQVEREARPASITWQVQPQNNIPTITRLERSLVLAVREKAPYSLNCNMERAVVVHGGKLAIPMKLTRHWADFKSQLSIQPIPNELPPGMTYAAVSFPPGKDDQTLNLNIPANVAPGKYSLVFKSFAPIGVGPKAKAVNVVQCSTVVQVIVLPKTVAGVSAAMVGPGVKPGENAELVVKVARQNSYTGEFKVKLVLPPDAKGLSANDVIIPAGQNEAKITLQAAPDTPAGPRNNLTVVATATLEGVELNQDTKININVIKK